MEKIAWFMNLLTDKAWSTDVWEIGGKPTASYAQFNTMFCHVFNHSPKSKEVGERPLTLRQGLEFHGWE